MIGIKKLKEYPILHRFLAELYKRCDIYETDDMFELIKDDSVVDYCRCSDKGCATVYLDCDRLPQLEDGDSEFTEMYDSDKGLIILHFSTDGSIEIEALECEHYPFKEELITVYNQDDVKFALESDLEEELQQKRVDEAQKLVTEYFSINQNEVPVIIVE